MSHTSANRFVLEGLEDRRLLSASVAADLLSASPDAGVSERQAASLSMTSSPAVAAPLAAVHAKVVGPTTPLTGAFNIAGTYNVVFNHNPDAGTPYHLVGSGRKRSMGSFTMVGDLQGPGFIASGRARGYVTLSCSQGTIDVRLLGPPQTPGSLPPSLAFKIVNGTGAYALATGKGEMIVSASDTTQKFVFRANQG